MHDGGGEPFGGVSGRDRLHDTGTTDALARAREDFRQRQHQHQRPAFLGDGAECRLEHHRRRHIRPEPDGVGGFPFAVTDIGMVVAGRAPPVDPRQAFAFGIGPELPEILADAAFAAAMPAGGDGIGDALCLDHAVRHQCGTLARARQNFASRRLVYDLADGCHMHSFRERAFSSSPAPRGLR